MRSTLRAGDIVARLGGDEFVALVSNCTPAGGLAAVSRMRKGLPAELSLSAGIAAWDQREELKELLGRADRALYAAKGPAET